MTICERALKLLSRTVVGAALALGAGGSACELLTARDGLQCTTNEDCQSREGAFAQSVCSADGVCTPVVVLADAGVQSNATCNSSEDCAIEQGRPSRCIGARCVPLDQEGCITTGPVSDDGATLIGVLVPQGGEAATLTEGIGFVPAVSGLGGTLVQTILSNWNSQQGSPPLFGAVICDESQLVAQADAGASTLVSFLQAIGPQAFVGTVSSNALTTLEQSFPKTPIFAPLGDDSALATPPSGPLHVWTCSPNRAAVIGYFEDAINRLSQYIAAQPGRGPNIKVAIAYNGHEPSEASFYLCLIGGTGAGGGCNPVTWAGGGTTTNPAVFTEYNLDTDVDNGAGEPVLLGETFAQFHPDLVVITGPILAESVITQVDDRWLGGPLPTYLVYRETDQLASFTRNPQEPLTGAAGEDGGASQNRVFGLDVVRDQIVSDNFSALASFEGTLADPTVENYVASPLYDCLYAAMFASAAAGYAQSSIAAGTARAASDDTTLTPSSLNALAFQKSDDILTLLTSGPNTVATSLAGTSMYYGLDPLTGVPTLQSPVTPVGLSCIDESHTWRSAGVFYAGGGPIGTEDGGAPVVSCP